MRDPFTWSLPLGRMFGITIRVHILFPLFALAMVLRAAFLRDPYTREPLWPGLWLDALVVLALGFVAVLLHELGHCFGARLVDGDAPEVLMWPLGGLAPLEIPHTPRANFIAAFAGPAVNLLLCLAVGLLLAAHSFRPALNPWSADADPLAPRLFKWSEGISYGTMYNAGDPTTFTYEKPPPKDMPGAPVTRSLTTADVDVKIVPRDPNSKEPPRPPVKEYTLKENPEIKLKPEDPAALQRWQVLAARFFWINWVLFLLNMLPAFPLDGGRMLQSILWWRGEFRQATLSTVFVGFVFMLIIALYGVVIDSVLPLLLALFIYATCRHQWYVLETGGEEPLFGYDFSQGYTSLERGEPPPPRQKRPNFVQRWLQRRAARKLQAEQEEREAEERRLDELLEKVKESGMHSLTEEERRFLTRVSSRYKNRH
jgi:Zn-dependent protease